MNLKKPGFFRTYFGTMLIVCLCLLLAVNALNSQYCMIAFAADASGDDITHAEIWQYNVTSADWSMLTNFTSTAGSIRIHDGWQTRFVIGVKFNATLVISVGEAITYTWVRMNITYSGGASYIWTNYNLTNSAYALSGSFYYGLYTADWNSTTAASLPVAGTTYNCTVDAQFYY